ncbi:hypothetical protein [Nostoc sp. 106C]|uniref:hypothetical protein n=1 Tax=Nostoc sp. 106C TaxID=1932667 RepID=UPI0014137833|nr:hypothetical protein [Nostoc sp. 106C]
MDTQSKKIQSLVSYFSCYSRVVSKVLRASAEHLNCEVAAGGEKSDRFFEEYVPDHKS